MGRYIFKLPDVGEGTTEAEIAGWHIKVGDKVEEDQLLVDVMTDKATVEMTAPVSGTVTAMHGEVGAMMPVGSVLIEFEVEGAGNEGTVKGGAPAKAEAPKPAAPPPKPEVKEAPAQKVAAPEPKAAKEMPSLPKAKGLKPLASPAVRRVAEERGIKLQFVNGTGPAGRITREDLDAFEASGGSSQARGSGLVKRTAIEEIKVIGMRRKIAEKMQDSKRRIPHFSYVEEVDMTAAEDLRNHLNATKTAEQPKLTPLPFFMLALAKVLPKFPQINVRYDDDAGIIRRYAGVHIGIATQAPSGLMVPVVQHAEARDIWDCANEVQRLAKAARDGSAARDELSGSTITLTSLGPLGGIAAMPVINYPEVAIICPNKIADRPVVKDGQIVVRKMMNLSGAFDHRVVDGQEAAMFIQQMKLCLENPATLFMP